MRADVPSSKVCAYGYFCSACQLGQLMEDTGNGTMRFIIIKNNDLSSVVCESVRILSPPEEKTAASTVRRL